MQRSGPPGQDPNSPAVDLFVRLCLHIHGYFEKWRHLPSFVPLVYTQTKNLPLKLIVSKNLENLQMHACM